MDDNSYKNEGDKGRESFFLFRIRIAVIGCMFYAYSGCFFYLLGKINGETMFGLFVLLSLADSIWITFPYRNYYTLIFGLCFLICSVILFFAFFHNKTQLVSVFLPSLFFFLILNFIDVIYAQIVKRSNKVGQQR
jgi:hypothetical protein